MGAFKWVVFIIGAFKLDVREVGRAGGGAGGAKGPAGATLEQPEELSVRCAVRGDGQDFS